MVEKKFLLIYNVHNREPFTTLPSLHLENNKLVGHGPNRYKHKKGEKVGNNLDRKEFRLSSSHLKSTVFEER